MTSRQRSVQFSENPVSTVRTISPPLTPKKMANGPNVVSKPSRNSTSSHVMGLGTVSKAKELLLRELEGFVESFAPLHLDSILKSSASTRTCQNVLKSASNPVYSEDGWKGIPESPNAEREDLDLSCIGTCVMGQIFGTVSDARGITIAPESFHDRWRYRLLLEEHGDTIDNLSGKTLLDVLTAIRDAISAHKTLWDAGIVHRDISCNNILYQKKGDADCPPRGVLIDFDLAIELLRKESNVNADFRTGTRAFQSVCVLESYRKRPHSGKKDPTLLHEHLDDLESFFWVLFWITREHVGPGTNSSNQDADLEVRETLESPPSISASLKLSFLGDHRLLEIQPGWGGHIQTLVRSLAGFFHESVQNKRYEAKEQNIVLTAEQLIVDAPQHYSAVLGHFDRAIAAIKQDMDIESSLPFSVETVPKDPLESLGTARTCVKSLPNTSTLLPAPEIGQPARRSSKRFRVAEPLAEINADASQVIQPLPLKRVRTAKSESALPRVTRAASLKTMLEPKMLTKLDKRRKNTLLHQDEQGDEEVQQASTSSRGRPSAGKSSTKATVSRRGSDTLTRRTSSRSKKRA